MMKKLLFLFIFLLLSIQGWSDSSATTPTIDFGFIYYCPDGSGNNTITIDPDNGQATPGGSGDIVDQSGGAAGSTTVSKSGFLDWLQYAYLYTKKSASATVDGCGGTVTITNAVTKNDAESANAGALATSATFPVGADLIVNSFSGLTKSDEPCEISGTVSGLLAYSAGSSSFVNATPLNLNITAKVVPVAKIAHNETSALNFGSICFSADQSQTITVSYTGAVTSASVTCPTTSDITADVFNVVGPTGLIYNVTLPASATLTNGVDSLSLTGLTPSCTSCIMSGTSATLNVGGTLTIPARSSSGDYIGHYQVTITY